MQYQVQDDEAQRAKNPHHIYNLNIILVHLFLSLSILKTTGNMFMFILVPLISIAVLSYIRYKAYQKMRDDTWFVSAHWMLAWRRGRLLIISYAAAIVLVSIYVLIDWITPSGMTMNNFAEDGSSTPIFQIITMFFGGAIVFFTVLITFLQTGISVYDAGKGIVDKKMAQYVPRTDSSNAEKGEYNDRDPGLARSDSSEPK
ncbi:hypothetical protein THIAE_00245 [Thiomicrospira aerophila AL3]|uniref:Uncharacterized protein n=1 Tax=Thiomicrospira aerophila AL3 TaxID=717772 RepID=W0DU29_9GAMM|nr:hypothetical protein [Thiomicrospira aerophila]AHF00381.1 hypothetical protein THIAE_00245 [Thiomicrospira aerophila AL3]